VIFDRFRQADSGLTRSYEGFGLGLAITRGNIEFLGGKIDLYSRLGEGSVFTCTIPVEFIEGAVDLLHSQTVIDTLKKMKILAVEDDEFTYILIHEFLKDQNVELVWAMNGADAVDKFSLDPVFDIVLMDLKMPVMDGYEATKLIKSINPGIPVIAISAFELDKDTVDGSGTFFDGHILKPLEKNDLLIMITQALNVKGL
jgi:CheY-like chemotaxis protein